MLPASINCRLPPGCTNNNITHTHVFHRQVKLASVCGGGGLISITRPANCKFYGFISCAFGAFLRGGAAVDLWAQFPSRRRRLIPLPPCALHLIHPRVFTLYGDTQFFRLALVKRRKIYGLGAR